MGPAEIAGVVATALVVANMLWKSTLGNPAARISVRHTGTTPNKTPDGERCWRATFELQASAKQHAILASSSLVVGRRTALLGWRRVHIEAVALPQPISGPHGLSWTGVGQVTVRCVTAREGDYRVAFVCRFRMPMAWPGTRIRRSTRVHVAQWHCAGSQ